MERDEDSYYNIKINPRNNDYPKNELDETRCKAALAPLTLAEMELKDEMDLPT